MGGWGLMVERAVWGVGVANESNLSGEGKHNVVPDYIIQSFGDLHKAATEGSS